MKKVGLVLLGIAGILYEACADCIAQGHEEGIRIVDAIKRAKATEEAKDSKGS